MVAGPRGRGAVPDPKLVGGMMAAGAADAVELARRRIGVDLDFTEGSVRRVERCLARFQETVGGSFLRRLLRRGPSPDQVLVLAKLFGGYLGEVFRQHHGGGWQVDPAPSEEVGRFQLRHESGMSFAPVSIVHQRLLKGGPSLWTSYSQLVGSVAQAEAATARFTPR